MRIEQLTQLLTTPPVRNPDARRVRSEQTGKTDRLDISDAARALHEQQQQVETIKASLSRLPEVRTDRLSAIAGRIADGHYNRPEVIAGIADAVLESGVVEDVVQARSAVSAVLGRGRDEAGDVRREAVERAKSRAEEGAYDRPEVLQKAAEEILKNFNEA